MEFQLISNSENETRQIAQAIAPFFNGGDLIILDGDLGTGKTHFVKGFAEGLHAADNVTSPTFSIANFYAAKDKEILHIDLYRIADVEEFDDLGIFDYFAQTITMIEWGKKFATHFGDYLLITIAVINQEKNGRQIQFQCKGAKYEFIMDLIRKKLSTC